MTRQAQPRDPNQPDRLPFICLAVDTGKKELWLESDGRILPEHHSDLPPGMGWALYQVTRGEVTSLPPASRFRLPGTSAQSDQVLLLGQDDLMYIYFSLSSKGSGSGYGGVRAGEVAQSSTARSPLGKTTVEDTHESLVVSADEYEKAKANFRSDMIPVEPVVLTENKAGWLRTEKLLYQVIEAEMARHRCPLSDLKIECGPDYTAATAQVHGTRSGSPPLASRRQLSPYAELHVDFLGNDVWYARSVPVPASRRFSPLDLEFLVCATGSIPEPNQAAWLQKGRTRQQETLVVPASSWRMQLPNGVTLELVGICENPSAGRPWWGPDGSPLGYAPCSTCERPNLPRDHTAYDIAWRVDPPQEGGLPIGFAPEGFWGTYHGQTRDRYGKVTDVGLNIGGYVLDRSREKTTLEFTVRNAKGEAAGVVFKNISLVRGKNPGFAIEVVK